jgi:hypothetical protein
LVASDQFILWDFDFFAINFDNKLLIPWSFFFAFLFFAFYFLGRFLCFILRLRRFHFLRLRFGLLLLWLRLCTSVNTLLSV